jgi:solute carrier family 25 carnitine/acylcarnitine transporter 20/29
MEDITNVIGDIAPGTVAGLTQTIVGYPFDSVKVKYINGSSKTIVSCIQTMYKDNGVRSFYQGVKAPLYGGIIYNSVMFYSYDTFDKLIQGKRETKGDVFKTAFILGSIIGVTTTVVESPMDFLKTQMQVNKALTFRTALRTPIKQMYRGIYPTLIRNIPSTAAYFSAFEYTQTFFSEKNQLMGSLVSGSMAGAAGWGLIYPLDNIKTRVQADNIDPKKRRYKNAMDCFRKTSYARMWSGFLPCISKSCSSKCIVIFWLHLYQTSDDDEQ